VATRAEFPEAGARCVYLSHALLQEGRDWVATEEALRAVLCLDPDDRTARNNLGVLLQQQGRPAEAVAVEGPTLAELYRQVCDTRSDLQEHCPTLAALARECRHVTEFGTGAGVSTVALLYARPGRLVGYDRERYPQMDRLAARAGRTEFVFHQADVLQVEIEETDLFSSTPTTCMNNSKKSCACTPPESGNSLCCTRHRPSACTGRRRDTPGCGRP
jgi:hypothetical protein